MPSIRILFQENGGEVSDGKMDFGPEDFAGQIPAIGDCILNPGVFQGLDRYDPRNRTIWTVVGRIFNPHDLSDSVGLIVESRAGTYADDAFA